MKRTLVSTFVVMLAGGGVDTTSGMLRLACSMWFFMCRWCLRRAMSSCRSKGLWIQSLQPSSKPFTTELVWFLAETMMIGSRSGAFTFRCAWSTSKPLSPGIIRSSRIRSGMGPSSIFSRHSVPFMQTSILKPQGSSTERMTSWLTWSSSTDMISIWLTSKARGLGSSPLLLPSLLDTPRWGPMGGRASRLPLEAVFILSFWRSGSLGRLAIAACSCICRTSERGPSQDDGRTLGLAACILAVKTAGEGGTKGTAPAPFSCLPAGLAGTLPLAPPPPPGRYGSLTR
mmetsp:Transcript_19029/g.57096  ORF Transcript_19029/g.57096 Transcript_19029/m.57096 type:complete len:286 (-) Transcript_19029:656-1513(-)